MAFILAIIISDFGGFLMLLPLPFDILDTWSKDVKCQDIADAIDNAAPGKLRTVSVTEVLFYSDLLRFVLCMN